MPKDVPKPLKSDEAAAVLFATCVEAVQNGSLIDRVSETDKEFSFQNWMGTMLVESGMLFDEPSRNAYPDFRLINLPVGFEVKGLGYPGREANYDCNSQIPSGMHNGREIYYVFGRYPTKPDGSSYPILDMVICHGDFLNSDHGYVHENKNIKGFGSYGDIMIRDRKMYVAPTPFALLKGAAHNFTLITANKVDYPGLHLKGTLLRQEADQVIEGYSFNLTTNKLVPTMSKNPRADRQREFYAYGIGKQALPVSMAKCK